jgi:hypothetical protein
MWAATDQALVSGTDFLTDVIVFYVLGLAESGVFVLERTAALLLECPASEKRH